MYWSLVTVIPNTDHKVGKVLRDQGYDFHLFQHTETFFVLSRKMIRTVLTFPRYVFVPICKCWKITNLSDDIIGPVKIGEDIAQVPPGVVEGLSSACTNGDDILNSLSYDFTIKPGQRVVVTGEDNNLVGEIGVYLRSFSSARALVEFNLMGRVITVSLEEAKLRLFDPKVTPLVKHRKRQRHRVRVNDEVLSATA